MRPSFLHCVISKQSLSLAKNMPISSSFDCSPNGQLTHWVGNTAAWHSLADLLLVMAAVHQLRQQNSAFVQDQHVRVTCNLELALAEKCRG